MTEDVYAWLGPAPEGPIADDEIIAASESRFIGPVNFNTSKNFLAGARWMEERLTGASSLETAPCPICKIYRPHDSSCARNAVEARECDCVLARKGSVDASAEAAELMNLNAMRDREAAHYRADEILCALLTRLGFSDVVSAFNDVEKWYA